MNERQIIYSERIRGKLAGYKLVFNKRSFKEPQQGFANLVEQDGVCVRGVLYRIDAAGIEKLDRFEGYPKHYTRKILPINTDEHSQIEAIVYIAQPEYIEDNLVVAADYLDKLKQGQALWGDVLACQLQIAVEGNALSKSEFERLEDDNEIPVLVDGCRARLAIVEEGFSSRMRIRFEDPHPEGRENGEFMTKYYLMESDGCVEWGHHGGCFMIQHRKV